MGMVVIGGVLIALTYWLMCRVVVPKVQLRAPKKKKKGPKMGERRAGACAGPPALPGPKRCPGPALLASPGQRA
jgi:hypothetical protein